MRIYIYKYLPPPMHSKMHMPAVSQGNLAISPCRTSIFVSEGPTASSTQLVSYNQFRGMFGFKFRGSY